MRDAAAMIHSLWDALQKVYRKHLVCGTHAYIHVARHPKSALLLRIFFVFLHIGHAEMESDSSASWTRHCWDGPEA